MDDEAEIALGVRVVVPSGHHHCIGVIVRLEGDDVIVRLTHAEWNDPPELRVHRDDVKCLAGWV